MFFNTKTVVIFSLFIFNLIFNAHASITKQHFELAHQSADINLDGQLTEAEWLNATHIPLIYQNEPNERGTPPVKTDAYLFEDGEYLYVAFKAYDPDPSKIRAALRDRDDLWADDNVALMIDTFNDERTGYEFYVNPLGAQGDMRMTDINGWVEDDSWNAIWDSAAIITTEGYFVEMRIPFTALRFPKNQQAQTWSIAVWRNYPRDVLYQTSNVGFDWNIVCSLCQFDKITGLENVTPSRNLQLTPTFTALRHDEKPSLPRDWQEGDIDNELGLDIRWGITQDAVLNATVNPDFSTVEADSPQLDINTNYSLFYAERRAFFLDGASFFDNNHFDLVYTRNIADPDIGIKLTGKTDEHSYGLMLSDDKNTSLIIPSNQGSLLVNLKDESKVAIGSYQLDIGNQNSLGLMATHRETDDYQNSVLSLGGSYWFNQTDSVQYQLTHSNTLNSEFLQNAFHLDEQQTDTAYKVEFYRENRDYELFASVEEVGEDFRADLGFVTKSDYKKYQIGGGQTWYGDEESLLTSWEYETDWDKTYAQNGDTLEEEVELSVLLKSQLQSYLRVGLINRDEFYFNDFFLQNIAYIQAGLSPTKDLKVTLYSSLGNKIDYTNAQLGDSFEFEPAITWDVSDHLQLILSHQYSQLETDNQRVFTANVTDLRAYYKFNMRSMLKLIVQFEDIDREQAAYYYPVHKRNREYGSQLVYSYKINSQTLFYLGYSDAGYQDDSLRHLEKDQRTFFTKFSYAWQM